MQILSALDAISPAIARTKLVLFTPFRKGRTWKLSATAYLATAGTIFLPFPLIYLAFLTMAREKAGAAAVTLIVTLVVLFTALYLFIFYLCSRIRFAFFDVVLRREQFIAPLWRKYGSQAFKWTLFKIVLGTLFTAALAVPTAAYVRSLISVFASLNIKPGEQPPPEVLARIFTTYAAFGLVYLAFGLFFFASSLLSDFIVPSLALEDTTLGEAFRRFGLLIRREPGQFSLYAVLKLGLAIVGYIGAALGIEIAFLIVLLIVGGVAGLIGWFLYLLHVPTIILIVLGVVIAIACYIFFFYCFTIVFGALLTFLESYKLYFLGGRYPMLGELLDRSTPPPAPPTMPPPGYAAPPYGP